MWSDAETLSAARRFIKRPTREVFIRTLITLMVVGLRVVDVDVPSRGVVGMDRKSGKMNGKASRWMRSTVWLAAACVCHSPIHSLGGVLLMELITDVNGDVAPKMHDLKLTAEQAREYHRTLIRQAVRMLCAGIVHGDLSQYNVLIGNEGPVVIDLPQAIDAAGNNNAGSMFKRDIGNLTTYLGRFAPDLRQTDYGSEIWSLYQDGRLHPEIELTGQFKHSEKPADVGDVIKLLSRFACKVQQGVPILYNRAPPKSLRWIYADKNDFNEISNAG